MAGESVAPGLTTNESLVAELLRSPDGLDVTDPKAVFDHVLTSLPKRVKVYPTENYYYFTFLYGGVRYSGNIRLDAGDRDSGKLHFTYFRQQTPWMGRSAVTHRVLDAADGVQVGKVSPLVYRVGNGNASVAFELNDLSRVRPPKTAMLNGEEYLGPVFDESGVRFFLLYNAAARMFHYVLDEEAPAADRLAPTGVSDRVRVGMRTGFAFYADHRTKRNILIGVYGQNEALNNALDGPFDQLPDNFIRGESLRQAIVAYDPDLKGRIDRLGRYLGKEMRYAISPYVRYGALADLAPVHECATRNGKRPVAYADCFSGESVDAGQ